MTSRSRTSDDRGSALVIALLFVTAVSVVVAAVLSFSETGLRAARAYKEKARSSYALDGAVDTAIHRFRKGGPCNDYTPPKGPDGMPLYGTGVIVRCVNDDRPATGRATRPLNSLLSLGAEGITTSSGFEQRVLGNVYSNTTVAAGGPLTVQGQVSATGACTGSIQTSPDPDAVRCANTGGGADPSQGRDPDYTKSPTAVPVHRVPEGCPADAADWLVELKPGYYDDGDKLSDLTDGSCPGRVVWLQPGSYYLDLTFRGGSGTWTIDDPTVKVVAGTPPPGGWTPSQPTAPTPAELSIPGSCTTDAGNAGVQVVAGGGTRIEVKQGRAELCAEPTTSDQSIALYGMGPERPTHALEPNDWTGVSGFVDPGGATTIGENPVATATASLSQGPAASGSLTLTTFRPAVPAGAVIDSVALRVVHREEGDMDDLSKSVKVTVPDTPCTGAQALSVPVNLGGLREDRIDGLKATCGLDDPADFAGLAITYNAALKSGGTSATATLDGLAIEVGYRLPSSQKPTAVLNASGFDPATLQNASEIGEGGPAPTADAILNATGPTAASITVAGLGDPAIPPGSAIDSAVLRVAHGEYFDNDDMDDQSAKVSVGFSGSTCVGATSVPLPLSVKKLTDDRVDLKARCGLDDASDLVGLTATYDAALATSGNAATAKLDGLWLELVYRPPPLTRGPTSVVAAEFANPDFAKVIGESPVARTADAALDAATTQATLTFGSFEANPPVPPGSIIDSAVLRVAHRDVGDMDTPSLALSFPRTTCPSPPLVKHTGSILEDRIDLKACGLDDPAQLAGLTATYTARLADGGTNATARVDGVVLDLAYRPPTTRIPTAAAAAGPGFADADKGRVIDGQFTAATVPHGGAPASVTVNGYGSIPPGSAVDSAVLRIAHQEDPWSPVTWSAAFPGSPAGNTCAGALSSSSAAIGVQRVDLAACGLTRAEQLAGLNATFTADSPVTTTSTQEPGKAGTDTSFANPDNARAIDDGGLTADAALGEPNPRTASINLSGYDTPALPPGSIIDTAELIVRHQGDEGVAAATVAVAFTDATCGSRTLDRRPTLGNDTIDVKACGLDDPSKLANFAVTYSTSLVADAASATARLDGAVLAITYRPPPGTARLDGIELDVVFRPPTFRPLSGCHEKPYGSSGSCALVKVDASGSGATASRFVAQGTVYAPTGVIDVSMAGLKEQVISRGVVARAIRLGLRADPGYKRPVMGVPPEPVTFTAYPEARGRASASTSTGFTSRDNAREIGESPTPLTADAALTTAAPNASLSLSGFAAPPDRPFPPGPMDAVVLRVVHGEKVGVGTVTVTVGGVPGGACEGAGKLFELPLYPSAEADVLGEDQIDLAEACALTDPGHLGGLTVTYTASLPSPPAADATARLDGITLDLLSGPLLRARVAFDSTRDEADVQGWSVLQ